MKLGKVKTGNTSLEYFTFGEGKTPFVILPGLGVTHISLSAAAVERAYSCFASDYTVYVLDRKDELEEDCTLRSIAEDTAKAMRALGIQNACVFGTSMGGMVAQYLAAENPNLVRSLVLGSTSSKVNDSMKKIIGEDWISRAQARDREGLARSMTENLYGDSTRQLFGRFLLKIFDNVTDNDLDRFILQARTIMRLDAYAQLDKIACPTLVIGVDGDKIVTAKASVELAEKLDCELYMYGNEYGHCAFDEAPDYKQRLKDFFDSH